MGLLALGGAISGMGQGLQQGLRTMQAGITQSGLAQEDRDFQMKKLQLQQDFEGQREQRGYAHSEKLQEQNQTFQTNLHEGDRQAASAEKEIDRTQSSIEKDKDRTRQDRKLGIEEAAQKSLDEYHQAVGSYYKDHKGRTGDPKAYKDLNDSTKALVEQHGKEADHYFKLAEGELDERRKAGYIQSGQAALSKGYALLGESPDPKDEIDADDPFGTSPLSRKPGQAKPAPKRAGLLSQVPSEPAAPPMSYDQRVEGQLQDPRFDQLKRYFSKPSGPPVPPGPGVTLPNAQ